MNKLLKLLKQNARLSTEQLSALLARPEEDISREIKALEANGTIMGYSAILNEELSSPDKVTALIELKVTPMADAGFDGIARTIMQLDEVESVVLMSGSFDLAVTVNADNLKAVADFVSQRLSAIDGVLSTVTHFVLKTYKDKGIIIAQESDDERSLVSP